MPSRFCLPPFLAFAAGIVFTAPLTCAEGPPAYDLEVSNQTAVSGSAICSFDFATPGQFETRFRTVSALGGGTAGQGSADRLVVNATSNGGNTTAAFLFDTTPADDAHDTQSAIPLTEPLTVSFLVRASTTDSVASVLFAHPQDVSNHVAAVFNLKAGADSVRFFRDGSLTARTSSLGTQIGSTVNLEGPAEPGSADYIRVTVSLSVSGTTPTLTVSVGDLAPVISAFAAGDIDWTRTLVLLRVTDASASSANLVEIASLVVAGAEPVTPPAPALPPAAGADGNLLTVNPGFETGSLNNFSGSYAFTGWIGNNALFSYHGINTGSIAAGSVTEGVRALRQSWGGTLVTAALSRPPIRPGQTVELRYDQRSLVRNFPNEKLGTRRFLEFFDAAGVRIRQVWSVASDYLVQYAGPNATNVWETFSLRAVAPPGAAYVGVRVEAPIGRFVSNEQNYTQDRHVEFDNFRLYLVPDRSDRLAWRRVPRLVEPGRSVALRIHHVAAGDRLLRASLMDATGAVHASGQASVSPGRFRATPVGVAIPADLPAGTYFWRLQLLPLFGGPAVATRDVPGIVCDQSVTFSTAANGMDFDADHPRVQFMGRVDNTDPRRQWLHWFGSEVRVRFSGTSLALRGSVTDNGYGGAESGTLVVVIDENYVQPIGVSLNTFNFVRTLVSGLEDGVHTARLFKAGETDVSFRVDGFRVDQGRGLLVPEPLSLRRLEFYGDSVTSGSSASPGINGYAPLLGRELDADIHVVSKGGTGVAASFASQDILVNYYDNLSFPNVFNASAAGSLPWDFNRWTPHLVLCAIGHNDQFNNGLATFNSRYAEFKGSIRAAYGSSVPFLTANTLISANLGQFQGAVDPLIAADPLHRFAYQPYTWNDSATAHPPTDGHAAMVYGDERRYSLAEVVEDLAGWGLDASASGYETWASAHFSAEQLAAGLHAPEANSAGDGVPNLLRYALGSTPTGPVELPRPGHTPEGRLSLSFFRAQGDVRYVIETSNDLVTWTQGAIDPGEVGGHVTWTDPSPAGPCRFARLRMVQP